MLHDGASKFFMKYLAQWHHFVLYYRPVFTLGFSFLIILSNQLLRHLQKTIYVLAYCIDSKVIFIVKI